MNIIEQLEKEHIEELGKKLPDFAPGDTVKVGVKVKEGERERVSQTFVTIAQDRRHKCVTLVDTSAIDRRNSSRRNSFSATPSSVTRPRSGS